MLSLSVHHNNHKAFFKMFCRFSGGIILKWCIQIIILLIFHTLIINGNESPLLLKQFAHLSSLKGSDIVFTCNVAKGTKPFQFQWHRNNVELRDHKRSRIESKDIYSLLTLYNIDVEDIGNYSCIVTNQFGFDKLLFHLDVTEKMFLICFNVMSYRILNQYTSNG
nr:titin-like [Dermatophagoides farinae]